MATSRPSDSRPAIVTDRIGDVVVITIDVTDDPVNRVGPVLMRDLAAVLTAIDGDATIRSAVLISGKPDVFIAGADIAQFLTFRLPADGENASRAGQELLQRLERLRVPVVAAIHGACLGAGMETALACAYRIGTDHPKTVLALPEVQLGILPGAGGTQRLPKLVGLQNALSMILEGRSIRANRALQMGLVDELVHPAILRDVAVRRAVALSDGDLARPRGAAARRPVFMRLGNNPVGRSVIFKKAREKVMETTRGHYPAPLAAIEVVRAGYTRGFESGLREEARRFGELAVTEVSRQLVGLFFATTTLKKEPGVPEPAPQPLTVGKIGVLGAGFMGAGITSVAVGQGILVRIKDTDTTRVGRGLAAIRGVLKDRLTRKQITRRQFDDQLALASGTTQYSGFGNIDLAIEAVFEDLALKQRVLREVEPLLRNRTIYASNTSTIPIARIAEAAERPNRVLGMHFFSPVEKMPLLEIIVTAQTDLDATATAVALGKRLGKTVIVVNDGPGFYTTRTLSAYMNEAGKLLDEGMRIDEIDRALVEFGFPVGPITLLDEVGIGVAGKVGLELANAFGPRLAPSEALRRVVATGRPGRTGRRGFYRYDDRGKKGGVDESVYAVIDVPERARVPREEVVRRCVLAMVNEAARCLDEGILRSPRDGDVGAVFGIGFPPFRGGPFRYVDARGADTIVRDLEDLAGRYPPRFEPAHLLVEMARRQGRFY